MTTQQIYEKYKIYPFLQLHMLRAGAIVKVICSNLEIEVDSDSLIKAALLHDMGNIIKADLKVFLSEEETKIYEPVKEEYIIKYGNETDNATNQITMEVTNNPKILEYYSWIGKKLRNKNDFSNIELLILPYADTRVEPNGIVSVTSRIDEAYRRYKDKPGSDFTEDSVKQMKALLLDIESRIFTHCKIKPDEITDECVKEIVEELRGYEIN